MTDPTKPICGEAENARLVEEYHKKENCGPDSERGENQDRENDCSGYIAAVISKKANTVAISNALTEAMKVEEKHDRCQRLRGEHQEKCWKHTQGTKQYNKKMILSPAGEREHRSLFVPSCCSNRCAVTYDALQISGSKSMLSYEDSS